MKNTSQFYKQKRTMHAGHIRGIKFMYRVKFNDTHHVAAQFPRRYVTPFAFRNEYQYEACVGCQ